MKLQQLLQSVQVKHISGDTETDITSLTLDSRNAAPGVLFFAVRGTARDGHDYIDSASRAGVSAVICEELPRVLYPGTVYVTVEDSCASVGIVAGNFYGHPSTKLSLIGITGTNGKTTTATLLYGLFNRLGYGTGLISTVEYRVGNDRRPSTHTTPDPIRLNSMLAEMVDAGCQYCFMEVSSHSVVQKRIDGLQFAGGVFTNITHDHLDYHGTFAQYIKAKKNFFDQLAPHSFCLINADDRNGGVMAQNTRAAVRTYSMKTAADFTARIIESHMEGMQMRIGPHELWTPLTGRFNAYNLLAVYGCAVLLGADGDEILLRLSTVEPVAGRFQTVRSAQGRTAVVDYAHTPDALQNVIDTINQIRRPGSRLIVVVGCGGDRDNAKRPVMARIAESGSDVLVLTSDNPRTEDPHSILGQMRTGLPPATRALCISDRREAIRTAVSSAVPGDVILIAGKGHETYQEINGVREHFDDLEEVMEAFSIFEQ